MGDVMTKGFVELSANEMEEVDGGRWYHKVGGAVAIGTAVYVAFTNPALINQAVDLAGMGFILWNCD